MKLLAEISSRQCYVELTSIEEEGGMDCDQLSDIERLQHRNSTVMNASHRTTKFVARESEEKQYYEFDIRRLRKV